MTYKEIQDEYKKKYNSTIKSCWIADAKRKLGIPVRKAYNRIGSTPKNPCPADKLENIQLIMKE